VDVPALQKHKSYRVSTRSEFEALLKDEAFGRADVIQLVEIVMPRVRERLFFFFLFRFFVNSCAG